MSVPNMTKKDTLNIVNCTKTMVLEILNKICNLSNKCKCDEKLDLLLLQKKVDREFEKFSTEHNLIKVLRDKNLCDNLIEFPVNWEVGIVFKKGKSEMNIITNKGVLMPVRFQMEKILNAPGIMEEMLKNLAEKSVSSSFISHFIQCSTWKSMNSQQIEPNLRKEVFIPVGLYSDGVQFNNALGPHTESFCNP